MRKIKRICVRVPATSANIGPGFDILGVALNLYNEIEVKLEKNKGIEIIGEGINSLPKNRENIVWQAMKEVFKYRDNTRYGFDDFHIKLINRIPLASGLGSSAAARLGGILIANELVRRKLCLEEILNLGVKLEGHPDNIVPAMVGGFCISTIINNQVEFVKLPFRNGSLKAVVCSPDFELNTDDTRQRIPQKISISKTIFNLSRLGFLLSAFWLKRYDLLKTGMQDKIHQPYRKRMVTGMQEVFDSAVRSGSYGVALSGSGPSILAFCTKNKAEKVGQSMKSNWKKFNVMSNYFVLDFDLRGAVIRKV